MAVTVEGLCDGLLMSGLMSPDDVSTLRQRWFKPNREAVNEPERFGKWLIMNQYLTELQTQMLLRGQADTLFFNQYKLLERIGKGRMAGVYKAVNPDGKTVAIKVLPPSKAKNPETLQRFQREGTMAVRLNHPNVVRTLETGEANGMHYIVMEYIEGATLEEVLQRRGRLTPIEAARIIGHALLGLQHIHEQQMIHRDLKPGNLMLATMRVKGRNQPQRVVKILDIGLGRSLFEEAEEPAEELTVKGSLLGTLEYMAPEQVRDAHAADIRSDIYSLGCVLYHCLAGKPPFEGANFLARNTEAPRPLRDIVPDFPETLQQIVDQMIAPDPNQRYQTPAGAARAVRVFLNTEESAEPPPETVVHADPKALVGADEGDSDQAETAAPARKRGRTGAPRGSQTWTQAISDELFNISDRDIIVFFIAIVTLFLLEGLITVLFIGHGIQEVILIACGIGAGIVVDRFWLRGKN